MDYRKEKVCIFANGQICDGPSGVTFECDSVKVIKVDPRISLDGLKKLISRKLELGPNQVVTNLVYRYPTWLNPPHYQRYDLKDDADVEEMWEMTRSVPTYTKCAELYANICDLPYGSNVESQRVMNFGGNMLPSSSNNINVMQQGHVFINEEQRFHSFESPLMSDTSIPTSSLPHVEDIVDEDEDEDEDEYDSFLSGANEDDDEDSDDDHEVRNEQDDRAIAFLSQIPDETHVPHEFSHLEHGLNFSDNEELFIRKRFTDVRVLRRAIKLYSVRVHHTFRVYLSYKKYKEYRCIYYRESCNWRVRAYRKEHRNFWEITKYNGPHTCLNTSLTQDHPKLDSDVIASCIVAMVTDKPDVKVSQIIERMQGMFGYTVSYMKAWKAKQVAITTVFGNWESSYSLLPRWLGAVEYFMPGSYVKFSNKQTGQVDSNGQPIEVFHRVFWAFKPCIDAFPCLKPIIQVDGTFLYGKYKGTLLMAISQDGDRNVVLLAFAIVEGETSSAWAWFLHLVRRIVVRYAVDICLILDRHKSILSAVSNPQVGWQPPQMHHVFYLRHVASNLRTAHGTNWLKEKFINIGYEYERHVVDSQLAEIALHHPPAASWIGAISRDKWSRAYDIDGRRFGHMTTNLAECMNIVFKGVRSLPICGLVKATMYRVNNYFVKQSQQVHAQIAAGQVFSETITKKLDIVTQNASSCLVHHFDRRSTMFEVVKPHNVLSRQFGRCYKVNLASQKCNCGEFQAERFPCMHVVAACVRVGIDHLQFVHHVFMLETMKMAYNNEFQPIGDEVYWPQMIRPTLIPDPATVREKGRPRSSRIWNEMDWTTSNAQTNRCGLCRQTGHNRCTCPQTSNTLQ